MSLFIGLTIAGLATGAIYAIAASGLVVTYTTSGVFNFAHGSLGMLMAFLYWQLRVADHWAGPFALGAVLLVAAPIVGAGLQLLLVRWIDINDTGVMLVTTLALLVLGMGVAYAIWPADTARALGPFFGPTSFVTVLGQRISYEQLLCIGLAIAVAIGLRLFLFSTRLGITMRAVVDDRPLVALNGWRTTKLNALSWAIGVSMGALAAILQATLFDDLSVLNLTFLIINSFAAAMLGRLRNLPLTFVGAIVLGLAASYVTGYVHTTNGPLSELETVLPTLFLIIVLLVLPSVRLRVGAPPARRSPRIASARVSAGQSVGVVAAVLIALPFLHGTNLGAVNEGLAIAILGLAVVLLSGYGGQLNLAMYTFLGLGAYLFMKLSPGGGLGGLVLVTLIGAGVGVLFALPALRLRGLELALSTLALSELVWYVLFNQSRVMENTITIHRLRIPFISLQGPRANLIFMAVVFSLLAFGVGAIRRSGFGRLLAATKDSPAACATIGMNLNLTKIGVTALATALATFAGALFGSTQQQVTATDFYFYLGLFIVLTVYIWGVHSPMGALAGGLSLAIFPVIAPHLPSWISLDLLVGFGALGMVINPNGTLDAISSRARAFWESRPARQPAAPAAPVREEARLLGLPAD
ncbi:MAG TPA: ABC transporter permease [Acidimicrobiales bacterium]|jgi:branched-chain amino acid transport system permease protein|nr:ABC transporter permease [Acidimicrobiales bacterium]